MKKKKKKRANRANETEKKAVREQGMFAQKQQQFLESRIIFHIKRGATRAMIEEIFGHGIDRILKKYRIECEKYGHQVNWPPAETYSAFGGVWQ